MANKNFSEKYRALQKCREIIDGGEVEDTVGNQIQLETAKFAQNEISHKCVQMRNSIEFKGN